MALLEAIVAMTILASAGLTAVALARQAAHAAATARQADAETERADAFLRVVSLWTRDDLDRRLGWRTQGPWRMHVERVAPELYDVTLADSTGVRTLLRTTLHRPRRSDARP